MESQLLQSRNTQSTLQLLHSRTLCAVCGAPAIGNRKKKRTPGTFSVYIREFFIFRSKFRCNDLSIM